MNIIIQTCVPSYRLNFFNFITSNSKSVKIIAGKYFYSKSIVSDPSTKSVIWVKNYFFFKRKILFQNIPFFKVLKADNVIIEFNLNNITFYIVFFLRVLLNKPVYLWGHAWSRKGPKSKSEYLRKYFKKKSTGYITYTLKQQKELESQISSLNTFAAPNAIYFKEEMSPKHVDQNDILNFIYVGRLVDEKKISLLVKSFHNIIDNLPINVKLIIIGAGPEFESIKHYVELNNLKNRVELLGEISNYNDLRDYYSKSIASISPGYVGLSITQSLGFGVPMLISRTEKHSPEIEASIEGFNSIFFETDNQTDLGEKLLSFFLNKEKWIQKRNQISEKCKEQYSIERMTSPFISIFK